MFSHERKRKSHPAPAVDRELHLCSLRHPGSPPHRRRVAHDPDGRRADPALRDGARVPPQGGDGEGHVGGRGHHALPGARYSARRDRRERQHRGSRDGDRDRWAGGHFLDVGLRRRRHVHQVLRGSPRRALSSDDGARRSRRRSDVLHQPRPSFRERGKGPRLPILHLRGRDRASRNGEHGAVQHRGPDLRESGRDHLPRFGIALGTRHHHHLFRGVRPPRRTSENRRGVRATRAHDDRRLRILGAGLRLSEPDQDSSRVRLDLRERVHSRRGGRWASSGRA